LRQPHNRPRRNRAARPFDQCILFSGAGGPAFFNQRSNLCEIELVELLHEPLTRLGGQLAPAIEKMPLPELHELRAKLPRKFSSHYLRLTHVARTGKQGVLDGVAYRFDSKSSML